MLLQLYVFLEERLAHRFKAANDRLPLLLMDNAEGGYKLKFSNGLPLQSPWILKCFVEEDYLRVCCYSYPKCCVINQIFSTYFTTGHA
jgi:hypothetical protein